MKLAVCVKHVPVAASKRRVDPGSKRLDRSGEGGLNPFDANAIEEALRIGERSDASEVVLLSVGPANAADTLRRGLAMGANRAVLVCDAAVEGSDLVATSYAIARLLEREEPEVVLFGQQSNDGDGGLLWAAVAERLRLPVISQVSELTLPSGRARGRRQTEYGYDVIEAPLPVVVAVSDSINEPRNPSPKGIIGAKKKPLEILSLGDLEIEPERVGWAGSRTEVLGLADPPSRGERRTIAGDGDAAEAIMAFLAERELV